VRIPERPPYLEPLVLQDSLDGSVLAAGGHLGLKHDTERSIADDLALGIRDLLVLPCQAILNLFADDLCAGKTKRETSVWKSRKLKTGAIDQHQRSEGVLTTHAQTWEQPRSTLCHLFLGGGGRVRVGDVLS
jgi:hypothetical protein